MHKKIIATLLMISITISVFCFVSGTASAEYYEFQDVDIRIIGACRVIKSDGPWNGNLYRGHLDISGANSLGSPHEKLNIKITKNGELLFSKSDTTCTTTLNDADGIFYWSHYGNGVSKYPPLLYIKCHAHGLVGIFT